MPSDLNTPPVEISCTTSFPFLGFQRVWFEDTVFNRLSGAMKAAAAAQTFFSLALLFLLGLALRLRFRFR